MCTCAIVLLSQCCMSCLFWGLVGVLPDSIILCVTHLASKTSERANRDVWVEEHRLLLSRLLPAVFCKWLSPGCGHWLVPGVLLLPSATGKMPQFPMAVPGRHCHGMGLGFWHFLRFQ
jgi:hypothetical protein